MGDAIEILLNGREMALHGVDPATTVLDWLRRNPQLRGTKEGCAEGDCGACSIMLERVTPCGRIDRRVVTSCILTLAQVDGQGIRTVEGVAHAVKGGEALQAAIAANGGSQCGFCTPGFVMSGAALLQNNPSPVLSDIHDAIAGNLCRCTGYRPIVEAIAATAGEIGDVAWDDEALRTALVALAKRTQGDRVFRHETRAFNAPKSLAALARLKAAHPDAIMISGGTDVGLITGRDRRPPQHAILLSEVAELNAIAADGDGLTIGAAVTYRAASQSILAMWPELRAYLSRLGSTQIRGMGTIGGNLGTASPIGDFLPVLLALDASILLHSERGARRVAMADFVTGYRRNQLAPDEVIVSVYLPRRQPNAIVVAEKMSRRRDQDISTVCAAFRLQIEGERVTTARIAFGGMADRPLRADAAERCLEGQRFDRAALTRAAASVAASFQPRDDVRAPATYRSRVAANLLERLYWRVTQPDLPMDVECL